MDIRELKRPPILEDPDTYDALIANAEHTVMSTPLLARPRNVAILALLQVAETMVGMANGRHLDTMVALAASGARPHAFPVYQAAVEAQLHALRPILRGIDLAGQADLLPLAVSEAQLREAGVALVAGARVASAVSFIDQAVIGWRGFRVTGHEVELCHRSPAHMRRRIHGAMHAEAAHNAALMDGALSDAERRFYLTINALQDGANRWDWMRDDALIAGALLPARRAALQLHRWDLDDVAVGPQTAFTVSEFRRVAEVVHAISTVADLIGDPLATRGASRVLRGPRVEWLRVLAHHAELDLVRVDAALEFMTRRAVDEPRGRTEGRAATTNPFFDLGGGQLALSVLCTMWQDPVWSLLATWTRRAPGDFGAKMNERGHRLATRVRDLFAARGWTAVLERQVPHSDLDVATAARTDPFMIVVEAKAFAATSGSGSKHPRPMATTRSRRSAWHSVNGRSCLTSAIAPRCPWRSACRPRHTADRETDVAGVEQLPPRKPPDYMVPLIDAHDRFLRDAYAFFASIEVAFTDEDGLPEPGAVIPYVLFAKLIQLGRAVHFLVASGYTEEAEPLGRAMVSAALNVLGIVDKEPDARALRFMEQSQEIRAQLIKGYIEEGYVSPEEITPRDDEWRAQEANLLKRLAMKGIVPAKIDEENKFTWHGLSDYKLAKAMNASRWYNLYYRNFSDEAHANVAGVARAFRLLAGEQIVRVGPSFNDPWMLMFASGDTIGESLGQLDTLYGLKRRAEVDAINERFGEALKKHREAMPAPDVPLALSKPTAAERSSPDAEPRERRA